MSGNQSSLNQRESKQLHKKTPSQNLQKSFIDITKTNPLPFIKKGIDAYINDRKMNKKKKYLQIHESSSGSNKSDGNIKRYDQAFHSIAEIYKNHEFKKRILISPNKILSQQRILEVFQPYRKEIEKLRFRKNLNQQNTEETPFSVALKQLGIFYQFESKNKNKMIPSRQYNNIYRSLPKKPLKQKLKPISETNIGVNDPTNQFFLNVQKINLLDNQLKLKLQSTQLNPKKLENNANQQKKQIQDNFQKIQALRRQKQYRMQPQMYIRKANINSSNIQKISNEANNKKDQKPLPSILKFYPSLQHNLKFRPVTNNGNISIFSLTKEIQKSQFNNNSMSQSQSFRVFQVAEPIGNFKIGQDDEMDEGFYRGEQRQIDCVIKEEQNEQQFLNKESKEVVSSPGKAQRKKRFFNRLPFQTYYYRDLIWKMNYSNSIFIETPLQYQHRLKAFIGKGNNSSMILGLIKRRLYFAITDKLQEANFVWTQLKQLPYFKKQNCGKTLGDNQNKEQDKSKKTQPQNNSKKQEENKAKLQYIKGGILNSKLNSQFKNYFQTYINFQQKSDQRFQNRQRYFKYQTPVKSTEIREQKVQNHLINNYVIGNKKALFHTMSNFYASTKEDVFDYLPLTFHIQNGLQDQSWYKFLKYYYKRNKQIKAANQQNSGKTKQHNAWIVKPGQNSNRGNGIQVCLTLEEIKNIVKKKQKYSDGSPKTHIVQSYIQKPLLYQKRKFDIRHYMMITCINGKIKGYFYRDGYVRTTSSQYNLKTNCGKIHLTNDAVQKNLPDYGKYQKGNKISYDELQAYMSKNVKNKTFDFYGKIYPKMKKIAKDVMKACSGGIDPEKLLNNFQAFGMDFMIDSNYDVWLIEVNTNPCLELSCPLLGSIIPRMVQNALQLTLDCLFPPPVRYAPKGVHYYKNLQQQNRFQLVYDEEIQGLSTSSIDVLDSKMLYEEDDTFQDDGQQWKQD